MRLSIHVSKLVLKKDHSVSNPDRRWCQRRYREGNMEMLETQHPMLCFTPLNNYCGVVSYVEDLHSRPLVVIMLGFGLHP